MSKRVRLSFVILAVIGFGSAWWWSTFLFVGVDVVVVEKNGDFVSINDNNKHSRSSSVVTSTHSSSRVSTPDSERISPTNLRAAAATNASDRVSTSSSPSNFQKEWIDVNPNSTISSSDVKRIWHDSSKSSVMVEFLEDARCSNPVLRGRLSGPLLTILDWEPQQQASETQANTITSHQRRLLTGRYDVPFSGLYFIEIIVLYCQDIDASTDFKETCLVPGEHHRLTAWNASIYVTATATRTTLLGHWVNHHHHGANVVPMYTRYQPEACRKQKKDSISVLAPHCWGPLDMARFEPYEFQWHPPPPQHSNSGTCSNATAMLLLLLQQLSHNQKGETQKLPPITLCFMGDSHSIRIIKHLKRQTHVFPKGSSAIQFTNVYVKFPQDIVKLKAHQVQHCTKIILGIGQWPASMYGRMTIVKTYQDKLEKGLRHLQEIYNQSRKSLYILSLHYNPLGDVKLMCPPKDWRNPRVVDLYNEAHKQLVWSLNMRYLDTSFIMSPMWDQAEDLCHYDGTVGVTEALYLVAHVLNLLP